MERSRFFSSHGNRLHIKKSHRNHITVNWIIRDYYHLSYTVISDHIRHIDFTEPYKWGITELDTASEQGHRKPCAAARLHNRYETNPSSEEVSGQAHQTDEAEPGSRHPVG